MAKGLDELGSTLNGKVVDNTVAVVGMKVRVCIAFIMYICVFYVKSGDLATSFVPPLHSFACPCNPHVLTYAMFTSSRLHKLCNAHLPGLMWME